MRFEVAGVKKPLMSVKRIAEQGNKVSFGPEEKDNFIINKVTGETIPLRTYGRGSYVMGVNFPNGEKTTITIDSGADVNVYPKEWGNQFELKPIEKLGGLASLAT